MRENSIKTCSSKLSAPEAAKAADYLMTLTDRSAKKNVVKFRKRFRRSKALRVFAKQYPCLGCHRIELRGKAAGGISGPDLRKAGERLNPDWVFQRLTNPQYWDPKTWEPKLQLSKKKLELLVQYIASLK